MRNHRGKLGTGGFELLLENELACILMDVQMPEMDGFETTDYIRRNKKMLKTPIIFITASEAAPHQVMKGYQFGGS